MNLALKINDQQIRLGTAVGPDFLKEAGAHKADVFSRLLAKINIRETRYDLDNCTVDCFDDAFSCYPCTDGYLTPDRKWQTKASLYARNDKLVRVVFQVIQGHYAASNFVERFNTACAATLGDPTDQTRWQTQWLKDTAQVKALLHRDRINAEFCLEIQDD